MSVVSEDEWRAALTAVLAKLDDAEFDRMWEFVPEIPKQRKTAKLKTEMPQKIIKQYGVDKSIQKINKAMDQIPRKDPAVQDLLRPLVEKLKRNQKENKGKRKHADTEPGSEEVKPEAGRSSAASASSDEDTEDKRSGVKGDPGPPQPPKERRSQLWRISIQDLKITGHHGNKAIAGKVVQKSGLRTYQTRNKEERFFFYLGVADDTSSVKVMVYGRERYQLFSEGSCFLFRGVIMEDNVMKVTRKSSVAKTPPLDVPENLEEEARTLIDFHVPVCSIAQANMAAEKMSVSVEGRVTEIGPVENIELTAKRGRKDKQEFRLQDGTGSIRITLWGDDTKRLRGISLGDVARVTNVQSAAVQNATIDIIGIIRAERTQTELEAELSFNNEVQRFVVDSSLLADAFGVGLEGDLEENLLSKMPFSADVEVRGNEIRKINASKEQ